MRSPSSCLWFLVAEQLGSDSLGVLGFQGQGDAPSPPTPRDARDSFNAGQHLSFNCRRTGLEFKAASGEAIYWFELIPKCK